MVARFGGINTRNTHTLSRKHIPGLENRQNINQCQTWMVGVEQVVNAALKRFGEIGKVRFE